MIALSGLDVPRSVVGTWRGSGWAASQLAADRIYVGRGNQRPFLHSHRHAAERDAVKLIDRMGLPRSDRKLRVAKIPI